MFQAHQGDVFFEEIAEITGKEQAPENGRHILAHGEVTGHHHSVPGTRAVLFRDDALASSYSAMLDVPSGAPVEHQEHARRDLPAGKIGVIIQSTYEPEEIRTVAD
ncbi:MAG: hypothetical protein RBR34_05620 [Rhodospirillaceae bacterium]|nr:hypothetical protein [Rhodospirillaceae bacterium]